MRRLSTLALAALLAASACTEYRETELARTATEQLLFSTAVERACKRLALELPDGVAAYVDETYVEGPDAKYLVAALRERILREGGRLVRSRPAADLVIEPRIGALSLDRKTTVVGVPGTPVALPLIGAVEFPELALLKRDRRQGVVKFAISAYDAASGALVDAPDAAFGFSERTDWVAFIIFGWQENDLAPDPQNDEWVGSGSFD